MTKRTIILTAVLLAINLGGKAQIFNPVCKETIWDYYRKGHAGIKFPEGKQVFYYKIRFESEPYEYIPNYQGSVEMQAYVSGDQLHYMTKGASVYQDQEDAFMLVQGPKVLVRANSGINKERDEFQLIMQMFSDSVMATSRVIGCKNVVNKENDKLVLVTLETGDKAMEALNVEKIVYQVNKTKDKVEKITMYYVRGHKYKKTAITHLETDLNFKREMDLPVKSIFFDPNGQLRGRFKAYRYIDNR